MTQPEREAATIQELEDAKWMLENEIEALKHDLEQIYRELFFRNNPECRQ